MTWLIVLLLAAGLGALLLRSSWRDRPVAAAVAATLALGLGGYAVAGRPWLPAAPAPRAPADRGAVSEFETSRQALLANYGDTAAWLAFSDALTREGRTADAVDGLQVALKAMPGSADLWIGLGQALTMHAGGFVSPAARLAFDRASVLAPDNPAPRYFLGLAWLQAGNAKAALGEWQALRAASPAGAPWLGDLDEKIAAAQMMARGG